MRSFEPVEYEKSFEPQLEAFLEKCLPESGRALEGRRDYYLGIADSSDCFFCMFDGVDMIGTVAVKALSGTRCELRSLYLYERYHGRGLGRTLLASAISFAKDKGFERMYLDTFSTSTKAIALYRRVGFTETERYKRAARSDVFMVLELRQHRTTTG